MPKISFILTLMFCFIASSNEIGTVMIIRGEAQLLHNKKQLKIKTGSAISAGDEIETKANSYVKVAMKDRNIVILPENSKLTIDQYVSKKVQMTLAYGSARHKLQQKYSGKNEKYEVRTTTTVAGVRGTDFLTIFNKDTSDSVICTLEGKVALKLAEKEVVVEAGNFAKVASGDVSVQVVETEKPWLDKALKLHSLE